MAVTALTLINRVRTMVRDWPQIDKLTAAVTDTTGLTLTVADATIYTPNTIIQVDQDAMVVASGASTTLTLKQRGARGTTAATHANAAAISIRPGFLDQEILDALNDGIDACYPYVYKEVLDTSLTILNNTYEYTVPFLPSTSVYIPRIWKVEIKVLADFAWRRISDWTVPRGATPTLRFKDIPFPGSAVRINGYGPFPHLANASDTLDAQFPSTANNLPVLYAVAELLASGEAGRVRLSSGAVDDREQATRVGSSMAASGGLQQRFQSALLNGAHCPPMQSHLVVVN
jgi:hypothetical protein